MWNFWPSNLEIAIMAVIVGVIGWGAIELLLWLASFVNISFG